MKFIRIVFTGLASLLATAQLALAESKCTVNGKDVPCADMPKWLIALPFLFMALGLFGFIFWLMMLIDAIKNEKEDKPMWVILIVLLNFLGAVIYYFVRKRHRAKTA